MTSKKHPESHAAQTPSAAETIDSRLDEALEESFPASDPIAIDPIYPIDPVESRKTTAPEASTEGKKKR